MRNGAARCENEGKLGESRPTDCRKSVKNMQASSASQPALLLLVDNGDKLSLDVDCAGDLGCNDEGGRFEFE